VQCHGVHHDRCLSNVSKTDMTRTSLRWYGNKAPETTQFSKVGELCRYIRNSADIKKKNRKSTKISPCLGGNVPTPQDLLTGGVPQCTRGRWHQTQRFFNAPVQVPGDSDFR